MIDDCAIAIPSRERANWLASRKYSTLDFMGALPQAKMWVRDDDSQFDAYYELTRDRINMMSYRGQGILGAAQTYDMLIDRSVREGYKYLIILDDDLKFSMHNPILGAKPDFRLTSDEELRELFDHALHLVYAEMPMLSFTPIMARSQNAIIAFCKPMMMAYVYYLPHFESHPEHRFWYGKQIEARCDLNLSLKLLTEGYLTAFMCTLFIPDNVNNPGGCSVYRDIEFERESVEYLRSHYPEVVSTHKKRGWSGDPDIIREAPRIQWKRAFNYDAFYDKHKMPAHEFGNELVAYYERKYADFVRRIREAN